MGRERKVLDCHCRLLPVLEDEDDGGDGDGDDECREKDRAAKNHGHQCLRFMLLTALVHIDHVCITPVFGVRGCTVGYRIDVMCNTERSPSPRPAALPYTVPIE